MRSGPTPWILYGLGLLVLALGPIGLYRYVSQLQVDVYAKQAELEQIPGEEARVAALRAEVEKRRLDIQRIDAFLVKRESIGVVVGEVEAAGRQFGVDVSVPEVREREVFDENGNLVEQTGPLRDVVVQVVATGPARALVAFMYNIEYLPRIVELDSWRLDASERQAQNLAATKPEEAPQESLLKLDVIVSVLAEEAAL